MFANPFKAKSLHISVENRIKVISRLQSASGSRRGCVPLVLSCFDFSSTVMSRLSLPRVVGKSTTLNFYALKVKLSDNQYPQVESRLKGFLVLQS